MGFIPKDKQANLEISKHAIRRHIIEEEKVERKRQRGICNIYILYTFQQIGTLSLIIFKKHTC